MTDDTGDPTAGAVCLLCDRPIGWVDAYAHAERADLEAAGAKEATNWEGVRVVVFPLCWINGEARYPPVEVEPGEQRREIEAAVSVRYRAYREARQRTGGSSGYRRD